MTDYRDDQSADIPGYTEDALKRGIAGALRRGAKRHARFGAALAAEAEADRRTTYLDNRNGALRGPVLIDGVEHWWCVCVCRWTGLRVRDPEVAKREYDAHPCSIHADQAVDRALAELDGVTLTKHPKSTLVPALAERRTDADNAALAREAAVAAIGKLEEQADAAEVRFALLELDR